MKVNCGSVLVLLLC